MDALRARKRRLRDIRLLHDDPGLPYIVRKDSVSKRYSKRYIDVTLRALAMIEAVDRANMTFEDASLPSIQLDGTAKAAVRRNVVLLTEIALFNLIAGELIDDKEFRERTIDLHLERKLRASGPTSPKKEAMSERDVLVQELLRITR